MLAQMWGGKNTYSLPAGVQIDIVTMKISVEVY